MNVITCPHCEKNFKVSVVTELTPVIEQDVTKVNRRGPCNYCSTQVDITSEGREFINGKPVCWSCQDRFFIKEEVKRDPFDHDRCFECGHAISRQPDEWNGKERDRYWWGGRTYCTICFQLKKATAL